MPGELFWFKNNGSDIHFVLTQDIDMSACSWGGGRSGVFKGRFDGQDYVIDKLRITGGGKKIGFFKEIGQNGIYFAAGTGTESEPYEIEDWEQLSNVSLYRDAHFVLKNDLDQTTSGYEDHVKDCGTLANSGKGWAPIGSTDHPFTGSFDGEGHAISDLIIDRADEDEVGLFGVTDSGGTIKNLRLLDITVTGDFQTGGLVGDIEPGAGPLTNIRVTGRVTSSSSRVGCLVGESYADISNAHADCTVSGSFAVGGLVGDSRGAVEKSSSAGSVQGQTSVGGLLGQSLDPVQQSFSRASVSGDSSVGGLIGQNMASITDAYATGSVAGTATSTGGLVGTNGDDIGGGDPLPGGNITRSYAAGALTGGASDGAFVGESIGTVSFMGTASYTGNFFDREVSGQSAATASSASDRTTNEMIDPATFTNAGWNMTPATGVWTIEEGSRGSYPYLQSISYDDPGACPEVQPIPGLVGLPLDGQDYVIDKLRITGGGKKIGFFKEIGQNGIYFAAGTGTESEPYEIEDWEQLSNVSLYRDAHFVLKNDLDQTTSGYEDHVKDCGTLANSGKGWAPIGSTDHPFTGSFDGEGHAISDLIIDRADEDEVGLFGVTDSGGTIKNLRLLDITVTGDFQTGGLVGDIEPGAGPLTNIRVTGRVTSSSSRVGCLVGESYADISNAHADCTVSGSFAVGGLVGDSRGAVEKSSSAGSVQGQTSVGGLLGQSLDPVQQSFSRASVSGDSSVGGLIGQNMASITDAYATGSVAGTATSTGGLVGTNGDDIGGGDPLPGGNITRSYAAGALTGGASDGAFVGESIGTVSFMGTASYTGNFFDREVSGQSAATASSASDRTTNEMIDPATFTNAGWNMTPATGVWTIEEGSRGSYPYLQSISYDDPGACPEVQPIPGLVGLPQSPTGIGASASDGQASVSWTAPVDDGGAVITGYEVTSTPDGLACTTSTTACTVTGLTNGTAYTFSVVAINMLGAGPVSVSSAAVTPLGAPAPPTGVNASVGNGQAAVSWTAPADDGGSAITGYEVTPTPEGRTCSTMGATSCIVTGLTNGTSYTFTVTAINAEGTSPPSPMSNAVKPATVPGAPTVESATAGSRQASVVFSPPVNNGGASII
ncbi:MAG: fibronectin type III domain-containing protein, partial [Wenzhouxiangella sp.]|nr:fibronectin type III domain-containing protein [Wenzhouxiangella sp.]